MLKRAVIERLEQTYCDGLTIKDAAPVCGVSASTVQRYFVRFDRRPDLVRGPLKRGQRKKQAPRHYRVPTYTGPDWIGKPA